MKVISTFSERLKTAMEIKDIRARDIVEATGISKAQISNYLKNRYEPKQRNIYLIAKCLGVNEAWLIGFDCEMDKYNSVSNELKKEILNTIDKMSEEQLTKILKFIQEYIVK